MAPSAAARVIGLLLVAALGCPADRPASEAALADRVACLERAERAALTAAVQAARAPVVAGAPHAWVHQGTTLVGSLWSVVDARPPRARAQVGARLAALDEALIERFARGRSHLQQVLPLEADDLPLPTLKPSPARAAAPASLLVEPDWASQWLEAPNWTAMGVSELWDHARLPGRAKAMGDLLGAEGAERVAAWAAERRRALRAAQQHRRQWLVEGLARGR